MDPFVEKLLLRARQHQKYLRGDEKEDSKKEEASGCTERFDLDATKSDGNAFVRSNSKTLICSEMPGSPQTQVKTLNIKRDNFDMQIKVSSLEDVKVEVEIGDEPSDDDSSGNIEAGLRADAKSRLNRLGQLYAGGDDANISSPIHRTESKFLLEENHPEASGKNVEKGKGLQRLAALAESINSWEDETSKPRKIERSPLRKSTKSRAPQPPVHSLNLKPIIKSDKNTDDTSGTRPGHLESRPSASKKKKVEIVEMTPKAFNLDKNVLDSLESQGYTRTASSSKLTYSYQHGNQLKPGNKQDQKTNNIKESESLIPKSPKRPAISKIKENLCPNKSEVTASPNKPAKDPALLSVSERKALFEKNKGEALLPKAPFAMATPITERKIKPNQASPTKTRIPSDVVSKSTPSLITTRKKTLAPRPPILQTAQVKSPVKSAFQNGGIASRVAALLENKSTISQDQIVSDIKDQRQKELEVLLNRFPKNVKDEDTIEEVDESYEDDTSESSFSQENMQPDVKTPETKAKTTDKPATSPKVAAVLQDVKRIKVAPPKAGNLYPALSDIEVTSTETETRSPSPDSSLDDSSEANTTFSRDILETVCKNQTPQKRPMYYDNSTESDLSDILDGEDDYLDEAMAFCASSEGPTPPKQLKNAMEPSNSFYYKNLSKAEDFDQFKSPLKSLSPRMSEAPNYVLDGEHIVPLTHTVSFYRKQQVAQTPPTKTTQIKRVSFSESSLDIDSELENIQVEEKIHDLEEKFNKELLILGQASQALTFCNNTVKFIGSNEHVEAERLLLLSTQRQKAISNEIQRLRIEGTFRPHCRHAKGVPLEKGSLTITDIRVPLKREYVRALASRGGKGHHVVCLAKCGEQLVSTKVATIMAGDRKNMDCDFVVPGKITLNDIYSDFAATFEVYTLQAQEELPHDIKFHQGKKTNNKTTPKKTKSDLKMPVKESPGGPHAVRTPSFQLMGCVVFSVQAMSRRQWSLMNCPPMSPLEGSVEMKISCELAVTVEKHGFLSIQDDLSGFPVWHRRWYLLKGLSLSCWKYPDDEKKMEPIETINLKTCITEKVGPVDREVCSRRYTMLVETKRPALSDDRNTLIMTRKGNETIIKHYLSADSKVERDEWSEKLNSVLTALKIWGSAN